MGEESWDQQSQTNGGNENPQLIPFAFTSFCMVSVITVDYSPKVNNFQIETVHSLEDVDSSGKDLLCLWAMGVISWSWTLSICVALLWALSNCLGYLMDGGVTSLVVMPPSYHEGCSSRFTQHSVRALCCFSTLREEWKLRERARQTDGQRRRGHNFYSNVWL